MFVFAISFLYKVSTLQEFNKMTTYNIAVVFSPCFLRPEKYTMEDLTEYLLIYIFHSAGIVVKII